MPRSPSVVGLEAFIACERRHPDSEPLKWALYACEVNWLGAGAASPCLDADYLSARKRYHGLLVAAGLLDPKLAD